MSNDRPWLFYPDYRAANPYQACLAAGLARHGFSVRPGDVGSALAEAHSVFHLGWEQPVYAQAKQERHAESFAETFLAAVDAFRIMGGTFVWTLHNAAPHEERFPALNAAVQQALARRADVVHVHNHAGAAHATGLGIPAEAIVLSRHPNFVDTYPDDVDDAAARRYLRLEPAATVFAYFGAIRPYKGLPRLLRAFDTVSTDRPGLRLIIAGRGGQTFPGRVVSPDPRLRLLARDVADAEIQYVMRAADCVVLPYEAILTSGALALARSFGRPVIVPDLPAMAEEVTDGVDGFLFAAGDDDALALALDRAADAVADLRGPMRTAARAAVADRTFAALAATLAAAVAARTPRHAVREHVPQEHAREHDGRKYAVREHAA